MFQFRTDDKQDSKEVFEALYGKEIPKQDLLTIERNITGFFGLLLKIDRSLNINDNLSQNLRKESQ